MKQLKTRQLGNTGSSVFSIGLGAMPLSTLGRPDETRSIQVIHAALDAGVDFIDTANTYCLDDDEIGHNERLIRKALDQRGDWDRVIVATKGGLTRPKGDWVCDARPEKIRKACEASLKALNTDHLFLYQLHAPDESIPLEDTLGELALLQKEGKILHIGLSNVNEQDLEIALSMVRIETVQNRCNPFQQSDIRNGLIDFCEKHQITYLPYSPLGGQHGHRSLGTEPVLFELGKKYSASPYALTLAWLLSKGPRVIPIPGASRTASIQDSASAPFLAISPEDLAKIDQLSPI